MDVETTSPDELAARFVLGASGRYGDGHAWVTFGEEGKTFLLEPLSWPVGPSLRRFRSLAINQDSQSAWTAIESVTMSTKKGNAKVQHAK